MVIDNKLIKTLRVANLSVTHYLILYCLSNDLKWHEQLKEDRMSNFKHLERRKLIDSSFQVTERGMKLLEGQVQPPKKLNSMLSKSEKEQKYNTWFSEFWGAFPSSDKFNHFPKTRTLRSNKLKAFKLYVDILNEGEYTHEQILGALKTDVEMKKKASVVNNQLRYLQAICTWLNKRIFEGFIEDTMTGEIKGERRYGEDLD